MSTSIHLTLPTPYGDATFTLNVSTDGVTVERLPLQGLPDSVWQLTYGKQWQDARAYFSQFGATLLYRLTALAVAERTIVPALDDAVRRVREVTLAPTDYGKFWASRSKQLALFSTDEAQLTGALDAFRQLGRRKDVSAFSPHLLPYLRLLLPIASHRVLVLAYAAIGALASPAAKEVLLGELESDGRHPYTDKILSALASFTDDDTLQRLIGVYRANKIGDEDLEGYVNGLGRFGSATAVAHVLALLEAHPEAVAAEASVLATLGLDPEAIAGHIHNQFLKENRYGLLDDLLVYTNLQGADIYRISLADMNARAADPVFTDTPPVNWPQQLEPGWRTLVAASSADDLFSTVDTYLSRPEPRLQRNAILQLKEYRRSLEAIDQLPLAVEVRLRELLFSRFDKVYVEILNILGDRFMLLADREEMLQAILEISIGSRYRFVILNALRKVGFDRASRAFVIDFYLSAIRATDDPTRLQQIGDLLPFLEKYLGDVTPLREALAAIPR